MATEGEHENGSVQSRRSAQSYSRANVTSRLPEYVNAQAEAIRAAFVPNTYRTIQSLGTTAKLDAAPFRAGTGVTATFSDFVYECSPFGLHREEVVRDRIEHEERMRIISNQPFVPGSKIARPKQDDEAFEFIPDPYDGFKEKLRQEKFVSESKCISEPFVPPGVEKALIQPTRALLNDILTNVDRSIVADWAGARLKVLTTSEDLICVYFDLDFVKNPPAVSAYMYNVARRNEVILEYGLRRVPEAWDIQTEDHHLMFTFRPPWVRARRFIQGTSSQNSTKSVTPAPL